MFYILYSALPTSFLFHPVCVWWVDAVWMPNSLSATHSLTLHPHEGRGENEIKKLMSFLASYCQGQTRFDLGSSHMFERNLCSSAWSTTSQISSFTLVLPLSFFSSFFLVLLLLHYLILFASFFIVFLKSLHPHLWAQLCHVVGEDAWLEAPVSSMGQPQDPLPSSCYILFIA